MLLVISRPARILLFRHRSRRMPTLRRAEFWVLSAGAKVHPPAAVAKPALNKRNQACLRGKALTRDSSAQVDASPVGRRLPKLFCCLPQDSKRMHSRDTRQSPGNEYRDQAD